MKKKSKISLKNKKYIYLCFKIIFFPLKKFCRKKTMSFFVFKKKEKKE